MDATTYARVKAIYLDALDLTPRERSAHLDRCCGDDSNLRAAVEALLGNTDDRPLFDDAPPADDPLRISGAVIDGGYTVGRCVAEGGFSHVYRGTAADGRAVALKLLKPGLGLGDRAALREAFDREAGLLSRLGAAEAAVVEAHGLVEVETPRGQRLGCLVMAWLDGAVLAQVMRRAVRPWSLAEVLAVLGPVARTLALAHHEGIAHRDVKPDNIFLVWTDGIDGIPDGMSHDTSDGMPTDLTRATTRLFDFGVAKVAALHTRGFESTGKALSAFTVGYAAPEQISRRFGSTGPWTDVYALALVCAELLAGRRLMPTEPAAIMAATLDPQKRPLPPGQDRRVERALGAALAVDPTKRPADAGVFWDRLEAAAGPRRWWRRG